MKLSASMKEWSTRNIRRKSEHKQNGFPPTPALPDLKAKQVVKIEFSPATLKLAKNVPFTFKRLLQRYLKNEELAGFTVFLRGKDSRGNNILYVKKTRQ